MTKKGILWSTHKTSRAFCWLTESILLALKQLCGPEDDMTHHKFRTVKCLFLTVESESEIVIYLYEVCVCMFQHLMYYTMF